MSKHPELHKSLLRNGVSFACAYSRLEIGWDLERAVSQPVRVPKPKVVKKRRRAHSRVFMWERAEWNAAAKRDTKQPRRARYQPVRAAKDTAPARIRRLRADYCDHFVKTGVLDETMAAQLRGYVNDIRTANRNSGRVSDEHEDQGHRRRVSNRRDDRGRDAHQIDAADIQKIADFLRV